MQRTCISASRPRYEKAKATTHARTQASIAPSRRSRGSDVHAHLYGAHATEQPRQRDTHTPARRPTKQPRHRHTRAHLRASHPRDEQQPTRTPARSPRDEAAKAATHVHTPARRPRDEAAKASAYAHTPAPCRRDEAAKAATHAPASRLRVAAAVRTSAHLHHAHAMKQPRPRRRRTRVPAATRGHEDRLVYHTRRRCLSQHANSQTVRGAAAAHGAAVPKKVRVICT